MTTPEEIVRRAVESNELRELLLGEEKYRYRANYSAGPGPTDLTALLSSFYHWPQGEQRKKLAQRLNDVLMQIVDTYEGLEPVAVCILMETLARKNHDPTLGLHVEVLAKKLQDRITRFSSRLASDKTDAGASWPHGRLDDFRNLSRNVTKYGGPAFFFEDVQDV